MSIEFRAVERPRGDALADDSCCGLGVPEFASNRPAVFRHVLLAFEGALNGIVAWRNSWPMRVAAE
jgi:hypothetical protein